MRLTIFIAIVSVFFSCESTKNENKKQTQKEEIILKINNTWKDTNGVFQLIVPQTGRYQLTLFATTTQDSVWVEDYINNTDKRTYNITGNLKLSMDKPAIVSGLPLAKGKHDLKIHASQLNTIDSLKFELIQTIQPTPDTLTQSMEGKEWELTWADEFNEEGFPDSTKWTYNIGNWGWGNNELQYYTKQNIKNARQKNGTLIIEAIKDNKTNQWTSARLTTQGKIAFKYGRIEFRAKVPKGLGVWAAGWLLGDAYRDEISWPYCGEIDVLECVGFEINDTTGKGLNHATCHTRAYYFKQNNQIGNEIEVDSMDAKFHTYAVEWYLNEIKGYLDGKHYYTYDKIQNELEWPFHQPQNIIVNLAIGGGWGGAKGVLPTLNNQQYILDYIRVYQKK